ncbi:unnamed protein product [Adineta steineri]|uniref:Uncharacterized protein n=2 Tax=Adineta steineri TaxID=433720 RepID=A0A818ULY6_9BILA|nr:unnamed protein product [Adineta steineri]
MIAEEIRLLDRVDNTQTIQSLMMQVDSVLNIYLSQQTSITTSNVRLIIWNKSLTDEKLETYFNKNFEIIKYDETYRDFQDKNFDYTRHSTMSNNGIWEKFIFLRVENEIITLFLSYTMESNSALAGSSKIDEFLTHTLTRMFNKIFNPYKSVYNHGIRLITDDKVIQYMFVYHDNHEGFVERMVPSFEDGLREQATIDQLKLSSCILKIEKGLKSLHSVRHPISAGFVVPNFHAHYGLPVKSKNTVIHETL